MYGIGVDIITVSRIEKSLQKQSFIDMVYGKNEKEMFILPDKLRVNSLAANYAGKEAFSKAIGTGVRGFNLDEVQILRQENGKPYFLFSGKALEIVEKNNLNCQISLSHEGDKAIAFVIVEENRKLLML